MTGKDAYFLAKREMLGALDYRVLVYEAAIRNAIEDGNIDAELTGKLRLHEVNEFRDYVRNVMLWNTENDNKE